MTPGAAPLRWMKPNRNPHWSTSGLRVTLSSRIDVEIRLKGYKYFEIERDLFHKLGVLIDGDFKLGVLLLAFVRFLGGDTGNLYRNGVMQRVNVSPLFLFPLNPGVSWKWTEYLSVLCLKVSIDQFCRKQFTKLANLLMRSQCALSEPISSSSKTRKLTVCRFI